MSTDDELRMKEQEEQSSTAIVNLELPYKWKQTLDDIDITIQLPKGTRAKQLTIDIQKHHLKAALGAHIFIEGKLHKEVKLEDSTWTIEDQQQLLIHLNKQKKQEWWSCVIQGHPTIDTTKIQPENSKLSDLDSETRSMVEKMMFDQAQKKAGKPTSDDMKKMEMMEKFKNAHPEMDFSKLQQ